GFIEVTPDKTIILAQTAEFAEDIDVDRAKSAKERAEARLKAKQTELDVERAQAALLRAGNRLRIAMRR
ncbi:MAG: ATP synthase delta/epsilon chain alpha-helix domain-containing protein, partial [bacterium]